MDQNLLVESGHKLLDSLERRGTGSRAAVWVHNPDTDSWRLWIVPDKSLNDKREFYRRISEAIFDREAPIEDLDVADTEMVSEDHPAIAALSRMVRNSRRTSIHMSNNLLNGFYLPDGIVLQMNL